MMATFSSICRHKTHRGSENYDSNSFLFLEDKNKQYISKFKNYKIITKQNLFKKETEIIVLHALLAFKLSESNFGNP